VEDVDDTYAALALMYGYAARYAPSTVIEARINALVVCYPFYKQTSFFFLTNLITNDMLAFKTTLALYKQICFVQSDEFDWYRNIVS